MSLLSLVRLMKPWNPPNLVKLVAMMAWLQSISYLPPEAFVYTYLCCIRGCCRMDIYQMSLWNNVLYLWLKTRLDTQVIKVITDLSPLYRLAQNVFECVLLGLIEVHLCTSGNPFGFKSKHSSDLCIFTLNSIFQYYKITIVLYTLVS